MLDDQSSADGIEGQPGEVDGGGTLETVPAAAADSACADEMDPDDTGTED